MTVKAVFVKLYKVTLMAEHGKITVDETGIDLMKVKENTLLHLTATPDNGYKFREWQNYDPETGLTVTADVTVTAVFEQIKDGIEEVESGKLKVERAQKVFDPETGTIYIILPDGKTYNAVGAEVR